LQHPDLKVGPWLSPDPSVWVILHSGSRGVGNKTGTFWTKQAQKLATKFLYDKWLPDPDLAYLPVHTDEYHAYMAELFWCQEFARCNREEMMDRVLAELYYTCDQKIDPAGSVGSDLPLEAERINCHHNYVNRENHDGENVLVTRKGAIAAAEGDRGLIPGSMGARSYIVAGLGHAGAYQSAPHGAGRLMSRTAARKQFTVEGVRASMEAQGIEANVREAIVDEAPGAYKDIDAVMWDARELVRPTHRLRQLVSVKGD
jgi:tRNA-splicing ligase RtcB